MKHAVTGVILGVGILLWAGCESASEPSVAQVTTEAETVTLNYSVKGMTCNGCVSSVKDSMVATEGVLDVTVSLEDESASISVADAALAEPLRQAIEELGFEATLVTQ